MLHWIYWAAVLALIALIAFWCVKIHRQGRYLLTSLEDIRRAQAFAPAAVEGRAYLHRLLGLDPDSLPPLGGWAASADFLIMLAEYALETRPEIAVEFGSGISTLVINRCLQMNGCGRLISFDSSEDFAAITRARAERLGVPHDIRAVELIDGAAYGFPGRWYRMEDMPATIDLLVVDGPPKAIHPETRGSAGPAVFSRLGPAGRVFLDDARRPGERAVADKWRAMFPDMRFDLIGTETGALIGRRR